MFRAKVSGLLVQNDKPRTIIAKNLISQFSVKITKKENPFMKTNTSKTLQFITVITVLTGSLLLWGCNDQSHMSQGEHHQETDESHMMDEDTGHHHNSEQSAEEINPTGKIVDGVRVIKMKARKFEFVPDKVVVSQGEQVRLEVTSEEVDHGISIAEYNINKKLPPNEAVTVKFTADKSGSFHFHCSVYCGAGHEKMHGELIVLESSE